MDAATISDSANTASRIENLTKYYGVNILLSGDSLQQITGKENKARATSDGFELSYGLRYLGQVLVKGKKEPLDIYECIDGDSTEVVAKKLDTLSEFRAGLEQYLSKEFAEAAATFQKIVKKNPADAPLNYS